MYEYHTKKIRSINASAINAEYFGNLAAKTKITQEEGSVDKSTTHVEDCFSETLKASENLSTSNMPHKRTSTMMASSKTQNYHICEIIYNIYEDNIFQKKKEINFVSITTPSFIKDTAKFFTACRL